MTLRNLAFASLLALVSCAGTNFAFADPTEAPTCDVANQAVTLEAAAAKQNLKVIKLDNGATQSFNAELAKEDGADVKDFPTMNSAEIVFVPKDDGENVALVFGFQDGCYVGAVQMSEQQARAILSRTQASF